MMIANQHDDDDNRVVQCVCKALQQQLLAGPMMYVGAAGLKCPAVEHFFAVSISCIL
jgi:hypothetical protein